MKNRGGRKEASSTDDHSLQCQGGGCCCLSVGADIGSSEEEEEGGSFTPVSHQVQQQQEGGRDYLLVICCRLTVLQPTQTKDSVSVTRLLQTLLYSQSLDFFSDVYNLSLCLSPITDHPVEAEHLIKTSSWRLERRQIRDARCTTIMIFVGELCPRFLKPVKSESFVFVPVLIDILTRKQNMDLT